MDSDHVKIMTDCIEICQLTADALVRGSLMHKVLCMVCADICDACAVSCEEIGDPAMMKCAETCYVCADNCRESSKQARAA